MSAYLDESKVLLQLSLEDCTKITGALLLLNKIDDCGGSLKNLSDRITYQMIQFMKSNEEKDNAN